MDRVHDIKIMEGGNNGNDENSSPGPSQLVPKTSIHDDPTLSSKEKKMAFELLRTKEEFKQTRDSMKAQNQRLIYEKNKVQGSVRVLGQRCHSLKSEVAFLQESNLEMRAKLDAATELQGTMEAVLKGLQLYRSVVTNSKTTQTSPLLGPSSPPPVVPISRPVSSVTTATQTDNRAGFISPAAFSAPLSLTTLDPKGSSGTGTEDNGTIEPELEEMHLATHVHVDDDHVNNIMVTGDDLDYTAPSDPPSDTPFKPVTSDGTSDSNIDTTAKVSQEVLTEIAEIDQSIAVLVPTHEGENTVIQEKELEAIAPASSPSREPQPDVAMATGSSSTTGIEPAPVPGNGDDDIVMAMIGTPGDGIEENDRDVDVVASTLPSKESKKSKTKRRRRSPIGPPPPAPGINTQHRGTKSRSSSPTGDLSPRPRLRSHPRALHGDPRAKLGPVPSFLFPKTIEEAIARGKKARKRSRSRTRKTEKLKESFRLMAEEQRRRSDEMKRESIESTQKAIQAEATEQRRGSRKSKRKPRKRQSSRGRSRSPVRDDDDDDDDDDDGTGRVATTTTTTATTSNTAAPTTDISPSASPVTDVGGDKVSSSSEEDKGHGERSESPQSVPSSASDEALQSLKYYRNKNNILVPIRAKDRGTTAKKKRKATAIIKKTQVKKTRATSRVQSSKHAIVPRPCSPDHPAHVKGRKAKASGKRKRGRSGAPARAIKSTSAASSDDPALNRTIVDLSQVDDDGMPSIRRLRARERLDYSEPSIHAKLYRGDSHTFTLESSLPFKTRGVYSKKGATRPHVKVKDSRIDHDSESEQSIEGDSSSSG